MGLFSMKFLVAVTICLVLSAGAQANFLDQLKQTFSSVGQALKTTATGVLEQGKVLGGQLLTQLQTQGTQLLGQAAQCLEPPQNSIVTEHNECNEQSAINQERFGLLGHNEVPVNQLIIHFLGHNDVHVNQLLNHTLEHTGHALTDTVTNVQNAFNTHFGHFTHDLQTHLANMELSGHHLGEHGANALSALQNLLAQSLAQHQVQTNDLVPEQ
ncbi:hypothetical protein KUTeg_011695 [Tegillarca granosa]|uniref:Uncharacterized protein n=1 Tax=Tegillarca granosa TaxID=220873 RepID=A0ABQ9EXE0_TEGGR|nr:hypothetical protein KUTeg_011695 [Tegillarca granosa]